MSLLEDAIAKVSCLCPDFSKAEYFEAYNYLPFIMIAIELLDREEEFDSEMKGRIIILNTIATISATERKYKSMNEDQKQEFMT